MQGVRELPRVITATAFVSTCATLNHSQPICHTFSAHCDLAYDFGQPEFVLEVSAIQQFAT